MQKLIPILLIVLLVLSACGKNESSSREGNEDKDQGLVVMTTLYPLQDFTEKIGGSHVKVDTIFPPGVDAHTYEPTPSVMKDLVDSDLFIYNGAGIEGFAVAAVKTLKNEDVAILEASHGIKLKELSEHHHDHDKEHSENKSYEDGEAHKEDEHVHKDSSTPKEDEHAHEDSGTHKEDEHGHDHGSVDPHFWLDPIQAIELAENIKDQLIKSKPNAKEDFEKNFNSLKGDLLKLDSDFQEMMKASNQKEILVSHAAYGYWEDRYGIEQISVSGLSPTNEPTQKQIKSIITETKAHNINYILFEQNVSTKPAEMIKEQLGLEILYLHNLSVRTEENITQNEDYFDLMYKNLDTLKKVFQN
ncbi:metal ABC transporter solute-binding protein, Zn/Mn family [Pseudalkalibacillus decolorationis]|uniref:metal ABC transporter solute-binding protein, Zn/Mn family n=1 Tax=Pseudalkalibacillus decolorationis TaxID=163879 RepID=UPI0021474A5B|nr:zinc ABC transporter substrate-binding protein [Pseudalkalibacillus decolorationis]